MPGPRTVFTFTGVFVPGITAKLSYEVALASFNKKAKPSVKLHWFADGLDKYWMFDLSHTDEIVETGYQETMKKLNERRSKSSIIKAKRFELLNFKR